jgi:acyl-CoA thioester hydrolase
MPDRNVPPLTAFPSRTNADIRYADTDRQGHVNNAVFATFSETGRVAFLYRPDKPLAPDGASFVIARIEIDFLAELHWPGTVEIGTGVSRIGRSSFGLTQAVFDRGRPVAAIACVIVLMDGKTRRSMPLPAQTMAALEELRLAYGS